MPFAILVTHTHNFLRFLSRNISFSYLDRSVLSNIKPTLLTMKKKKHIKNIMSI